MSMTMRLTAKQIEILKLIHDLNDDGTLLDITQLRLALSYTASKQATLCSVKALVARSLIERAGREVRNGRNFTTLRITALGKACMESYVQSLKSVLVESEDENILEEI